MINCWQNLPSGFKCLAPMEGVTDTVFRRVMVKAGKPDLMFSEFTGVEQLFSLGYKEVVKNLEYMAEEKPLILQLWGVTPELFTLASDLAVNLGYDGVDINMSCPAKPITSRGAGSALVNDQDLAMRIIDATQIGVAGKVPVSVKIRLGYNSNVVLGWADRLLGSGLAGLTIHGRTKKELSRVPAEWLSIKKVVELRDQKKIGTKIIGNGDVKNVAEANQRIVESGVDGVMIGRGIFYNPWLFAIDPDRRRNKKDRLELLTYHLQLLETTFGMEKNYDRVKRFYKVYLAGFPGSRQLRDKLMRTKSIVEANQLLDFKN
jgi:nifR3 family TIM-barrel protein